MLSKQVMFLYNFYIILIILYPSPPSTDQVFQSNFLLLLFYGFYFLFFVLFCLLFIYKNLTQNCLFTRLMLYYGAIPIAYFVNECLFVCDPNIVLQYLNYNLSIKCFFIQDVNKILKKLRISLLMNIKSILAVFSSYYKHIFKSLAFLWH